MRCPTHLPCGCMQVAHRVPCNAARTCGCTTRASPYPHSRTTWLHVGATPGAMQCSEDMRLYDPRLTGKEGRPWQAEKRRWGHTWSHMRPACIGTHAPDHTWSHVVTHAPGHTWSHMHLVTPGHTCACCSHLVTHAPGHTWPHMRLLVTPGHTWLHMRLVAPGHTWSHTRLVAPDAPPAPP